MKKLFFILLIPIALLLAACVPEADAGGTVLRGTPPPTADISVYDEREDVVYITKTGSKYHKEDCSFLKKSKIPVSLEQVLGEGKTPCSRCHPDG